MKMFNHLFFVRTSYQLLLVIPAIYLFDVHGITQRIIGFLLLILTAYLYSFAFRKPIRIWHYFSIVIQAAIILSLAWFYSIGYFYMEYYLIAIIIFSVPPLVAKKLIALTQLIFAAEAVCMIHYQHLSWGPALLVYITVSLSVFAMYFIMSQQIRLNDANLRLRQQNAEIEFLTQINERERISRELHDVMGHELASLTLGAQLAQRQLQHGHYEAAEQELKFIETAARGALNRVRQYIAVNQTRLFHEELHMISTFLEKAGWSVSTEISPCIPQNHSTLQVFAACLREISSNIVHHSEGEKVWIRLLRDQTGEEEKIWMLVQNDGQSKKATGSARKGLGLMGIQSRISAADGQVFHWQGEKPKHLDLPNDLHVQSLHEGYSILLVLPLLQKTKQKIHEPHQDIEVSE